jgi:hypothetical protein
MRDYGLRSRGFAASFSERLRGWGRLHSFSVLHPFPLPLLAIFTSCRCNIVIVLCVKGICTVVGLGVRTLDEVPAWISTVPYIGSAFVVVNEAALVKFKSCKVRCLNFITGLGLVSQHFFHARHESIPASCCSLAMGMCIVAIRATECWV